MATHPPAPKKVKGLYQTPPLIAFGIFHSNDIASGFFPAALRRLLSLQECMMSAGTAASRYRRACARERCATHEGGSHRTAAAGSNSCAHRSRPCAHCADSRITLAKVPRTFHEISSLWMVSWLITHAWMLRMIDWSFLR